MSVTERVVNGVIVLPPGTVLPEGAEVKVETLATTAVAHFKPDERADEDDYDLEPPLSIAETEELRKVQSGRPLNEILSRVGIP